MKTEARLEIIDGNPFIHLPPQVLANLFDRAGKDRGPIPIRGTINDKPYQQTLVKYRGAWRLYVNMKMLKDSPRRIGEIISVKVDFDPSDRKIEAHPLLTKALRENEEARQVFERLSPSRQKEIVRYIGQLKSEDSIVRNVARAINFLLGKGSFVGRDAP